MLLTIVVTTIIPSEHNNATIVMITIIMVVTTIEPSNRDFGDLFYKFSKLYKNGVANNLKT